MPKDDYLVKTVDEPSDLKIESIDRVIDYTTWDKIRLWLTIQWNSLIHGRYLVIHKDGKITRHWFKPKEYDS
jgi:hypothetical protein